MKLTVEQRINLAEINTTYNGKKWKIFPNPADTDFLDAPIGAGVYHVKQCYNTRVYIFFGTGECISNRFTPLYTGRKGARSSSRNNTKKHDYVIDNFGDLKYRTAAC